jgi:hypothetical protein
MSDQKGSEMTRWFIQSQVRTMKTVKHLAIELDVSHEKLAGYILDSAAEKLKDDIEAARKLLPRKPPAR